jgi:hypothetical protein
MLSWRGGLNATIGSNAFLIACLLNDAIVVREASPESSRHQQSVEITKRLGGDPRRADRHLSANDRIDHPSRHDNRRARFSFHMDNLGSRALLLIEAAHCSPMERMPAVVDRHFLPDTGRITARWP